MLFNSYIFLIFLAIVIPIFLKIPKHWKKPFLLMVSYIFYGFWDWRFCILLLLSTTLDFFLGKKIAASEDIKKRKTFLAFSLVGNLGILMFFKYFNFFVDSFQNLGRTIGYELDDFHLNIILPVGVSFYTFQTLSYTIDIFRKKLEPTQSFLDFALFVSFFPQLVAGPIERARNLLPQIAEINRPTKLQLREGFMYITFGLFMKMIIGDNAGAIVDMVFANPSDYSSTELLIAPAVFLVQVYGDFGGYSLVARGVAKLLGVELMVNFKQPFLTTNYTDFWRRWHISLYGWFREYIYFTLGGSRKGLFRTYLNVLILMTLAGFWHGASWNFIIWGFANGVVLMFDKWVTDNFKLPKLNFVTRPIMIAMTLLTFSATLPIFRTYTMDKFWVYWEALSAWESFSVDIRIWYSALTIVILTFVVEIFYAKHEGDAAFLLKYPPSIKYAILAAVWIEILLSMAAFKPEPFVYFQF
jgi:alginate O-acetyltransferase complex protein AlgI